MNKQWNELVLKLQKTTLRLHLLAPALGWMYIGSADEVSKLGYLTFIFHTALWRLWGAASFVTKHAPSYTGTHYALQRHTLWTGVQSPLSAAHCIRIQLIFLVLQAVVVSIDPRRVFLKNPDDVDFKTVKVSNPGKETHACLFWCLDTFYFTHLSPCTQCDSRIFLSVVSFINFWRI